MKMMSLQQISKLCLGAALSTVALGSARADLLVYDPFDYGAGTEMNLQNGGQGFVSEWIDDAGTEDDAERVRNGSLSYGNLQTSGNSMQSASANGPGLLLRGMENAAGAAGSTTWVSFIFSLEVNSGSIGDFDQFSFYLGRSDPSDVAYQVGVYASGGNMYFGLGDAIGPLELSSTSLVLGETYFVTASIEWDGNGTNEVIRLYVNPSLDGGTPDPSSAIAMLDMQNLAFGSTNTLGGVGIFTADLETVWAFDELRIGTTFGDIAPVPEPSSAFLLLGGLGILNFARRRRVSGISASAA